jgi:hypothetical protein
VEIKSNGTVFLLGHRGAVAPGIKGVLLELTVALTKEHAVQRKGEVIRLLIPADHAEKVVSSIQTSLQRLRGLAK